MAEDNPVNQELIVDLLQHAGLTAEVASDGKPVLTEQLYGALLKWLPSSTA